MLMNVRTLERWSNLIWTPHNYPKKKNIVSEIIGSVQVPVFTPGSVVQNLRVTQIAGFSSSSKALTLKEAGTQVLLSVIQKNPQSL